VAEILDGAHVAADIREHIKAQIDLLRERQEIVPGLAVVMVGEHAPSRVYVNSKKKACHQVGIFSMEINLPPETTRDELLTTIHGLNSNPRVHGILVQLPLPDHLSADEAINAIDPVKDIDGFHPVNVGRVVLGQEAFVPCTPLGVMELLRRYQIQIEGKRALVIGRSTIVGKPMAFLLLHAHATVTIAHSRTADLPDLVGQSDIVVAAIGKPSFVKGAWIKKGAVVVDVGTNSVPDPSSPRGYHLEGDVEFAAAKERAGFITPVPGGAGPMTIALLLQNTLKARHALLGGGSSTPTRENGRR
jgi:methylenetetrahydrofolate dehydrogenase (NADP+) / methenyltetrahydrofolate cyclohydrolase